MPALRRRLQDRRAQRSALGGAGQAARAAAGARARRCVKRVAVVGPGAIGATMAAVAARTGAELVLCGRTPLDRLVVGGEPEAVGPGPVPPGPAAVPWRADLVLLAVKAHQT